MDVDDPKIKILYTKNSLRWKKKKKWIESQYNKGGNSFIARVLIFHL